MRASSSWGMMAICTCYWALQGGEHGGLGAQELDLLVRHVAHRLLYQRVYSALQDDRGQRAECGTRARVPLYITPQFGCCRLIRRTVICEGLQEGLESQKCKDWVLYVKVYAKERVGLPFYKGKPTCVGIYKQWRSSYTKGCMSSSTGQCHDQRLFPTDIFLVRGARVWYIKASRDL